mgnify:CR=1 FL=1
MDISTKAVKKTSTERGEYYEVYPKRTFTFDIALSNVFNSVQDPEYVITTGGEGEVYFGTEYASADTTNFGDFEKIALNDSASKFITSATITDNTLIVKTGDMKLEDFYESSVSDGYGTTYCKHYVYEDEFDLIADNEFKAKSKENITLIKSAYFYVNVKDKTSGLERKIKLFFVDAPAAKLSVTSDLASTATTERGEFYTLEPKKTYTFNIVAENIETPSLTVSVSGSGSAYFGTEVASSEMTSFNDIAKKQISAIADRFITSAKIENGKLKNNQWQPCFTAHGDESEYNAMTETYANAIIGFMKAKPGVDNIRISQNDVLLGYNDVTHCSCDACRQSYEHYGNTI